jgi:hypothetical protein
VHLALADVDAAAVLELSGDAQRAVGATRVLVDLRDLTSQPRVPERSRRRRTRLPVLVARHRHPEHQAGPLHVKPLPGQGADHREEAFGGRYCSRNTSLTFLDTASSVSS